MSLDDFSARARERAALVPVWRDCLLDTDTPVSAFAKLRRGPFAFLLESAPAGGETWARYTFLGTEPRARVAAARRRGRRLDTGARLARRARRRPIRSPISKRSARRAHTPVDVPELGEFWSGAVGYFSYDIVRLIERLPNRAASGASTRPTRCSCSPRAGDHRQPARRRRESCVGVPVAGRRARRRARSAVRRGATGEIDDDRSRGCARRARSRRSTSTARAARSTGTSSYERAKFIARRRADQGVHPRGRLLPGAARAPHRRAARFRARRRSIARCARSIRRRTCTTSCSTASRSSAARPSCSCAWRTTARDGAPDRRHAAARPTPAEDDEPWPRAARRREGARRARDARRSRPQRRRTRSRSTARVKVTELMMVEQYSHVLHIVSQVEGELRDGLARDRRVPRRRFRPAR